MGVQHRAKISGLSGRDGFSRTVSYESYNISILSGHDPIASALYRPIRSRQNIVRPQSVLRHASDGSGGLKTDFNVYAVSIIREDTHAHDLAGFVQNLPNAIFSSPYH